MPLGPSPIQAQVLRSIGGVHQGYSQNPCRQVMVSCTHPIDLISNGNIRMYLKTLATKYASYTAHANANTHIHTLSHTQEKQKEETHQ